MINAAAMLGLGNEPAIKELSNIKLGIQTLFKIKEKDYDEMRRESKREREEDKRRAQDMTRILNSEAQEMERIKLSLESSEGGVLAALIGGAALLGALQVIKKFNLGKFLTDIRDGVLSFLPGGRVKEQEPSAEVKSDGTPASAPAPSEAEAMDESGDITNLESSGTGKALPLPPGVSKGSPPGMRNHPVSGGYKMHNGWDMPAPVGTPLTIRGNGKFVSKGFEKGYGNWVVIRDQRGEHFYSHLSKHGKFKAGDSIKTGDIVAYTGNTGTSTGPHLHWEFDTRAGKAGMPRPKNQVMDPLQNGYKWSTPFTGLQKGGVAGGGAVAKATHYIRDHEALASLTPGKWDWIKPVAGAKSYATKKPWESVNDNTLIYPYRDRGAKKTPTIGWGTTWLGGMMSGQNPVTMKTPPMPKKKADEHLTKDVASLTAHLAKTISYWKHLTESQKAGFISIGYNAGQNAHITKSTSKFFPYRDAIKSGNLNRVISPDVMPHYKERNSRRKDEINMLKDGPMDYSKHVKKQRGGFIAKKSGGIVPMPDVQRFQAGGNVKPTSTQPQLYENYTPDFFTRQSRKSTQAPVIIVNKVVNQEQSPTLPGRKEALQAGEITQSYTDIAQTYYRYVGGIKI